MWWRSIGEWRYRCCWVPDSCIRTECLIWMRSDKSGIRGSSLITHELQQIIQFRYRYSSESTAKCITKLWRSLQVYTNEIQKPGKQQVLGGTGLWRDTSIELKRTKLNEGGQRSLGATWILRLCVDYNEFSIQYVSVTGHVQKLQIAITLTVIWMMKLSVCLIEHKVMKKYWGMEVFIHLVLSYDRSKASSKSSSPHSAI